MPYIPMDRAFLHVLTCPWHIVGMVRVVTYPVQVIVHANAFAWYLTVPAWRMYRANGARAGAAHMWSSDEWYGNDSVTTDKESYSLPVNINLS